jgi:hypothetical protein
MLVILSHNGIDLLNIQNCPHDPTGEPTDEQRVRPLQAEHLNLYRHQRPLDFRSSSERVWLRG